MSDQNEIKTTDKNKVRMKLLRRIFIFFLVTLLLPLPLFPLMRMTETADEWSTPFYFAIIGASIVGVILIAMALLGIGPVVIELLDIRKREKEEREDPGIFP
jgi:FtsH-binding integral membrane protein